MIRNKKGSAAKREFLTEEIWGRLDEYELKRRETLFLNLAKSYWRENQRANQRVEAFRPRSWVSC